jgi:hypothetical protein
VPYEYGRELPARDQIGQNGPQLQVLMRLEFNLRVACLQFGAMRLRIWAEKAGFSASC